MEIKKRSFFKRVLWFFKPFWAPFALVLFLMIVTQVANTLSPYIFGRAVDAVTSKNIDQTMFLLGVTLGLTIFHKVIISWVSDIIEIKKLGDHIQKTFSVYSIEKMFSFSIGQHTNEHSGVKQSTVNKGQQALANVMFTFLYTILPILIQILVTVVMLAIFDWKVAGIAVSFVAFYTIVNLRRNKLYFPIISEMRKKEQNQSKLQSELYRNSTLVIAEAQESATKNFFEQAYDKLVVFKDSNWLRFIKTFYLYHFIIIAGQYATLGYGVYLILIGEHSVGMFVTLFSWSAAIFSNLQTIMRMQRHLLFQKAEIEKYFELLDIEPDIDPNLGGQTIEPLRGEIEFKQVNFAYPYRQSKKEAEEESVGEEKEQEHAIENVSFTIPAGAKVGFVGVSGSGKSTIVNLMRRFYDPTQGEILIDGIPLKELDLKWFRSRIGNVEQKIDLFDRSVRENIVFGLPDPDSATDEMIEQVVKDASLTDFVTKLKDHGLDTVIGEGGDQSFWWRASTHRNCSCTYKKSKDSHI